MKGHRFSAVSAPAVVELVHTYPAARDLFPIAHAIDTAIRWNV